MGGDFKTMVAKVGIFDRTRGVTLNRGVFIEAPKDFFLRYGDDMEEPTRPFDQQVNVKVRIEDWKGRTVPQTAAEKQKIEDDLAAAEAKREADEKAEAARLAAAAAKKPIGMGTDAGVRPRRRKE